MVLFYDSKKKNDKPDESGTEPPSALRRWTRRLFKLGIIIGILFVIGLGILYTLGGQRDSLKKGAEQYLTKTTGLKANIETMEYMGFFPDIRMDFKNIDFGAETAEAGPPARIGSFYFSMSFWDLFFSRMRVEDLQIENARLSEQITGGLPLSIHKAYLTKDEDGGGFTDGIFKAFGHYGDKDFTFFADVETVDDLDDVSYTVDETLPVQFESDFLRLTGHFEEKDGDGVRLVIDTLGDPEELLKGTVTFKSKGQREKWAQEGTARLDIGRSVLDISLRNKENRWAGEITADPLDFDDSGRFERLVKLRDTLFPREETETPEETVPRLPAEIEIDFQVNMKNMQISERPLGSASAKVSMKDSVFKISSLDGTIAAGDLSGFLTVDGAGDLYDMSTDIKWKNWSYEELETALLGESTTKGTAVTELKVSGAAGTLDGLIGAQTGEFVTVGGTGQIKNKMINLWGKGLFSSMFPEQPDVTDLNMNCFIADFVVEDGVAKAKPVFLDTVDVMIEGTGTIDLGKQTIDMKLRPENKGLALFANSTAVIISGDLFSPAIRPAATSIGKSLGKLFFTTINPAFLASSFIDLGIGSDHPCYQYFPEREAEHEAATTDRIDTPDQVEGDRGEQVKKPAQAGAAPAVKAEGGDLEDEAPAEDEQAALDKSAESEQDFGAGRMASSGDGNESAQTGDETVPKESGLNE